MGEGEGGGSSGGGSSSAVLKRCLSLCRTPLAGNISKQSQAARRPPAVHPRGWRSCVLRKQEDEKSSELIKSFSSMKLLSPLFKQLWQAEEFKSLPSFKFQTFG